MKLAVTMAVALIAWAALAEDVIKLKSGKTLRGEVVEYADGTLKIRTADGKIKKGKIALVEHVRFGEQAGPGAILVNVDTGKERAILEKEPRYTDAQFQYLGDYMRRKQATRSDRRLWDHSKKKAIIPRSSGHSVLLIAPPKIAGSSQYAENRLNTIKNALKDGFANRLTISGTVHLEPPEA